MKRFFILFLLFLNLTVFSQRRTYDVMLLGKKIGYNTVERVDKGNGTVEYDLTSYTSANIFFAKKTSYLEYRVVYKDGKLFSSYCKSIKDEETEITSIQWDGTKYQIHKDGDEWQQTEPVDYSALMMYFVEPKGRKGFFSERLGRTIEFTRTGGGEYDCRLDNGVLNIYRYTNGVLTELDLSKGIDVVMKLVQ